jgi:hypothetical protein
MRIVRVRISPMACGIGRPRLALSAATTATALRRTPLERGGRNTTVMHAGGAKGRVAPSIVRAVAPGAAELPVRRRVGGRELTASR